MCLSSFRWFSFPPPEFWSTFRLPIFIFLSKRVAMCPVEPTITDLCPLISQCLQLLFMSKPSPSAWLRCQRARTGGRPGTRRLTLCEPLLVQGRAPSLGFTRNLACGSFLTLLAAQCVLEKIWGVG